MESKVIITGASSGIGKSIYEILTKNGYKCYGFQRTNADYYLDLSYPDTVLNVYSQFECAHGIAETVIINAGYSLDGTLIDLKLTEMVNIFNVNIISHIELIKHIINSWKKYNVKGNIILIGSQAALPGYKNASNVVYSATKAAIYSLMETLSKEYPEHARVNCISLGDVITEGELRLIKDKCILNGTSLDMELDKLKNDNLMSRLVTKEEISQLVLFVMSYQSLHAANINASAGSYIG
ncbi:SDR family oxidoreductase [Aliivibrio fischeri]|uniref:SDR family oxidoreductase n=1 Tax=Aliivibrio fischeri TaxID=668 RepID=UPI001F1D1FD6|nr:SDR family oxidoreductase [Aliivibrio fischeri]MCE7534920.1 SDR family oxidoreductase [Aliivibrio fischeri]MCE7559362.1 SDR family oxidoreductase [Aliivibrio fischeri]